MEKTLGVATAQDRIAYLDILANGREVIKERTNKYLPVLIVGISLFAITGIIIYYELELKKFAEKK